MPVQLPVYQSIAVGGKVVYPDSDLLLSSPTSFLGPDTWFSI